MKKKYSTPNLIKAVSLSAAMATLLSSVSPVFAANLAIRGSLVQSTTGTGVSYEYGSHGSIVFVGDDDYCGVDNVIGRGGNQQKNITDNQRIPVKEQYERFINGYNAPTGGNPYGTNTEQITWISEGKLSKNNSYMGKASTDGFNNALPEAYGVYSFATGCGSSATGNYSTAFGAGATAKTGGSQAFGVSALASGKATVAIGIGSEASGEAAVAFGGLATASGISTVALGEEARAEKEYAIAIGARAEAKASGSIAIGGVKSERTSGASPKRKAIAEAENAIAIGSHTYAKLDDTVAIGANAQALIKDGVAVGGGSVSRRAGGGKGYDPATGKATTETSEAWKSTAGAFSIGDVGKEAEGFKVTRQITGVAAGTEDTDAVNVAQLKAISAAASGAWKLSANGKNSTDVNPGSTIDFSVKNSAVGKDNLKITKSTQGDKHKIQLTLSDTLKLTKVTTGQSSMSDDGFIIDNGPKMILDGIDAGNKAITGVADATKDDEAVNYKQLKEIKDAATTHWQLTVNGKNAMSIGQNDTVNLQAANKQNNQNIKIVGDDKRNVTFDLADNINVMTVTAGESVMDAAGFRFDGGEGPSITVTGIHAGDKTIKGVAKGEDDTDAVNVAQLKEFTAGMKTGWKLSIDGSNAIDVKAGNTVDFAAGKTRGDNGKKNIKIHKDSENKVVFSLEDQITLISVTTGNSIMSDEGFGFIDGDGPRMAIDGIDAGNKKITSVADAKDDTDAVNYKQLKDVKTLAENGWKLSVDGNNSTDVKASSTVDLVAAEGDGGYKNIKIEKDSENKVTFSLNDALKLTSVTTGNSIMNSEGFKFVDGGPSITANGINAGSKKITNVADAEEDKDAVNYKQLKDLTAGIKTGWKLAVEDGEATDVKAGSTVKFVAAADQDEHKNIKIVRSDNNEVTFDLNELIKVNKIKVGDEVTITDNGLVIKRGPSITYGGIDAGDKEVKRVADGILGTDAVNLNQLKTVEEKIKEVADNSLVKWEEDRKLITIGAEKEGVEINVSNSKGESRVIAGLIAGKISRDSTEAINGSQLLSITETIADFFGGKKTDIYNGIKPDYTIQGNTRNNVFDAFAAVDTSITNIDNKISNVIENSLVKWNEDEKLITIGKEKGGTKINIAGTGGDRTVAGVKNGKISEDSTEAINGSQINKISTDIAKFFGGDAAFQGGVFVGPRYNLSKVSTDGTVERKTFENVGDALEGLDVNVRNVNTHIQYVDKKFDDKFDKIYQDALLWSDQADAFVALHGENGKKTNSKIKYLEKGEITEDSTDAINGSQLFKVAQNTSKYFGGETDVIDGIAPTFIIGDDEYHNVTEAFTAVDDSITDIYNQINNVTENSLVKWDESKKLITIGKNKAGTEISILNNRGMDRKLSGVKDGMVSQTSTEAVNGSQLFKTNENVKTVTDNLSKVAQNTSKYFGGSADVLEGIKPTFVIDGNTYHNVTEAFTGVNTSITNIDNKISDVVKNSLVKQEGGSSAPITIGKDTAGTEINIAGYGKVARSISGVQAAENGDEAVNKDQLDKSIEKISKDIDTVTAAAVLYDKNDDGGVNYGSVTLGGDKNNGPVALHNVKDGSISQDSKDAINGSQINKISADIAKFFGGGAKFVDGAFKGLKYTLSAIVDGQVGKANFYDVGSALTGLDKNVQDVNQRLTKVSNEFNQTIEGISKDALLWDDEEGAFVARHEKDGQKTNSKLKYLLDGEIAKGSTDAITGNQLYLMSNQLANYFGGGAKYKNGKWTDPTFKISKVNENGETVETEHNNVADAFGDINDGMSNINNRIDDVINKVDSDALKWNEDKKAYDANRDGKPSKITGVADGEIAEGSKDAVNGGQLWKTNERITGVEKDVKHISNRVDNISNTIADIGDTVLNIDAKVDNIDNKVNDIAEDAVRYDRDENGKKINKITLKGGDPSEPVLIDNVADGKIEKGSKEAVNGGQLHDYTQEQMKLILDESKHYTDQRVNNIVIDAIDDAVERSKQYTDMKFDALNYSIESVKKEARQAAAIGLAVSNLRYNDTPGKLSVGFGTGLWRSQSAFAFGAGYTSEKGNIRSNVSVTTSGGHWGVGAGFNMTLN